MIKPLKTIDINIKTSTLLTTSIRGKIAYKLFKEINSEVRAVVSTSIEMIHPKALENIQIIHMRRKMLT